MLGPTLFLIFINEIDIAVEITGAMVKKFADDTKCYMVVKTERPGHNQVPNHASGLRGLGK